MSDFDVRRLLLIPEIVGLDARSSLVRIPPELDVPLTPRVRRLVDSRVFRRLTRVSQLGFVRLVYPGATHSRFEHSLGVYRVALLILKRLAHDERFAALVRPEEAEILILAALLHDVGHFPFCHLLEDLKLPGLIPHEEAAASYLLGELAPTIRADWNVDPTDVCAVLSKSPPTRRPDDSDAEFSRRSTVFRLLASVLSGPIDVDKTDYLLRDSCAAGVPYGKNYDVERLIGSVCLNERGDGIAISTKGKTAAELMVFARYVMFSEVYWHHASRSATVMFQRAVDLIAQDVPTERLIADFRRLSDAEIATYLLRLARPSNSPPTPQTADAANSANIADFAATSPFASTAQFSVDAPLDDAGFNDFTGFNDETAPLSPADARRRDARRLLLGLFGPERRLFKRVRQFSVMEEPALYPRLAGRPYSELREISERFATALGVPGRLLVDAPPVDKEVEFKIDVFYPEENVYRPLATVSPVVRALAQEQFDDYVKRVRVFAAPEVAATLRLLPDFNARFARAVDEFEADARPDDR
ncbi:MAG: HD domain-containing protein [Thermoguttaceae bacterium]|nr:HD domain-containing protein [Thermoguttaceae bacterium]